MRRTILFLCLLCACDGGGGLEPGDVTNLPPGDATGSAASGSYQIETITTSCGGACLVSIDGFQASACDVGTRLDDDVDITQTDGVLVIDVDDSDYVSRLEGGIDADGGFEAGGFRTQQGGEIVITALSTGAFAGDTISGEARLRVRGGGFDCLIGADFDGARR